MNEGDAHVVTRGLHSVICATGSLRPQDANEQFSPRFCFNLQPLPC